MIAGSKPASAPTAAAATSPSTAAATGKPGASASGTPLPSNRSRGRSRTSTTEAPTAATPASAVAQTLSSRNRTRDPAADHTACPAGCVALLLARPVGETPTPRPETVRSEKPVRAAVPTVPECPGHRWPGTRYRSAQPRPPDTCPRHTRDGGGGPDTTRSRTTHSASWGEAAPGGRAPIVRTRQLTSPAEIG